MWTLVICHQDRFLLLSWNTIITTETSCQLWMFLVLFLTRCAKIPICIKAGYNLELLKSTLSRNGFTDRIFMECKSSTSWFLDFASVSRLAASFPFFFSLSESSVCLWFWSQLRSFCNTQLEVSLVIWTGFDRDRANFLHSIIASIGLCFEFVLITQGYLSCCLAVFMKSQGHFCFLNHPTSE